MTVRKAERLLNLIVLLLETKRPLTSHEIRETVPGYGQEHREAFLRMFERDKEDLREMGIPLEVRPTDAWEVEEGYLIPKERYYLPELTLSPDEAAALWVAAGLLRLRDPAPARTALLKLAEELPADPGRSSMPWLIADLGLSVSSLPKAFEAVTEAKKVAFAYTGGEGTGRRVVDPYGLVYRKGSWYLVGRDHGSGEIRSFRLDRLIGDLHFLSPGKAGPEFSVPERFRPQAALETPPFALGEPGCLRAKVRFHESTAWWVERGDPWLRPTRNPDGSAEAEVDVGDPSGFLRWLLSYGEGAELLAPEELRAFVRAHLEAICG
ncbi:MAG: helix-turn-helix transcriptional regulator [Actinomycetota bacterium]